MVRAAAIIAVCSLCGASLAIGAQIIDVPQTTPQPAPSIKLPPMPAPLDQPKQQSGEQQSAPDNRGTEQVPLIIKEVPRERTAEDKQEAKEKSELDRKLTKYTGDLASYTKALFIGTLLLALLTGCLAAAAFWQIKEGRKGIQATERAAKAAENAVVASLEALSHARETAERDFRPWLTLNARLISPVDVDLIRDDYDDDEDGFAFFIELHSRNVGKVAALNVIYSVSGIDIGHHEGADDWLQNLIEGSIHACTFAGPQSWRPRHSLEYSSDALAPSEEYKAKRYCRIPPLKPDSVWREIPKERRVHQFCVGIVAAYSSVGSGPVFYTAKVLPIGKINLPGPFMPLIGATELPVGIDEVGIGPTYKAIAT